MTVNEKLSALRKAMQAEQIDAYVVYDSDAHMSEYLPEHFKERRWISGFTGSAGVVVVTADKCGLWTDGRYYLQAEQQLSGTEIILYRAADVGTITVEEFLLQQVKNDGAVGVNGRICSTDQFLRLQKRCSEKDITVRTDLDLIAPLWTEDRPAMPHSEAFLHPEEFSGLSTAAKLTRIREMMRGEQADCYIIGALDSVDWLMNLRGSDAAASPLFTAFAIVWQESATLFADRDRLPDSVVAYLTANGVDISPYGDIYTQITDLPSRSRVALAGKSVNAAIYQLLGTRVDIVLIDDYCETCKAVKNHTEMHQLRITHQHDGVAMVRFLMWLEQSIKTQHLKEYSISEKLLELRSQQPNFKSVSFGTISGYGANGAIVHYAPSPTDSADLAPSGLLLVDSGGQYLGGTTDITRTIALGDVTAAQRRDFTLVLQSFIRLHSTRFLEGCTGKSLDVLARQVMWDNDLDYKHGTGHGIGFFLNVHEGPNNFSNATTPLVEGMVISIEPGIYRAGQHGIRTENSVMVVKDRYVDGVGQFFRFEPLSLCPIDTSALDVSMLSKAEIQWLNDYHSYVYEKLSPLLEPNEVKWLGNATQPIHQ